VCHRTSMEGVQPGECTSRASGALPWSTVTGGSELMMSVFPQAMAQSSLMQLPTMPVAAAPFMMGGMPPMGMGMGGMPPYAAMQQPAGHMGLAKGGTSSSACNGVLETPSNLMGRWMMSEAMLNSRGMEATMAQSLPTAGVVPMHFGPGMPQQWQGGQALPIQAFCPSTASSLLSSAPMQFAFDGSHAGKAAAAAATPVAGSTATGDSAGPYWLASLALAGEVIQNDSPNPPRPRKTEMPAVRLRKVLAFIQEKGRRPTRKSRDSAEKTLGVWLHRFICNDDGVRDRAQKAMPPHEFDFITQAIASAPDAKQVTDKQVALSNVEAIAQRALSLQAVPLRGDASGCGKKLHNIRQGRLGPGLRDAALAIVRRILGSDSNCAGVLAHLEASIELSSARQAEYLAKTRNAPTSTSTTSMESMPGASPKQPILSLDPGPSCAGPSCAGASCAGAFVGMGGAGMGGVGTVPAVCVSPACSLPPQLPHDGFRFGAPPTLASAEAPLAETEAEASRGTGVQAAATGASEDDRSDERGLGTDTGAGEAGG